MKKRVVIILLFALVFTGCDRSVTGYWEKHGTDISDISAAEDVFAIFAEKAVAGPEEEAVAEMDRLFDRLKADTIAYYVYGEWSASAFYSLLSPCRNCSLFTHAVDRMESDGVIDDGGTMQRYLRLRNICRYNRVGDSLTLPVLYDRDFKPVVIAGPARQSLFLVLDLGCPSCMEAIDKAYSIAPAALKYALVFGPPPIPNLPGWEVYRFRDPESIIDFDAAPYYFIAGPDGKIQTGYTKI